MLPPPAVLNAYPEQVQQKILAWQEDQVLGEARREHELWRAESQRQDRLVESAITAAGRGQKIAAGLFTMSIGAAFVLALRGNNTGAAIALAPAVLGFLGKYLEPWLERDRRGDPAE